MQVILRNLRMAALNETAPGWPLSEVTCLSQPNDMGPTLSQIRDLGLSQLAGAGLGLSQMADLGPEAGAIVMAELAENICLELVNGVLGLEPVNVVLGLIAMSHLDGSASTFSPVLIEGDEMSVESEGGSGDRLLMEFGGSSGEELMKIEGDGGCVSREGFGLSKDVFLARGIGGS